MQGKITTIKNKELDILIFQKSPPGMLAGLARGAQTWEPSVVNTECQLPGAHRATLTLSHLQPPTPTPPIVLQRMLLNTTDVFPDRLVPRHLSTPLSNGWVHSSHRPWAENTRSALQDFKEQTFRGNTKSDISGSREIPSRGLNPYSHKKVYLKLCRITPLLEQLATGRERAVVSESLLPVPFISLACVCDT